MERREDGQVQTDILLKRLTAICAADLLPLLGAVGMGVVRVEILELPIGSRAYA